MPSTIEQILASRLYATVRNGCVIRARRKPDGTVEYPVSVTLQLTLKVPELHALLGDKLVILDPHGTPVSMAKLKLDGIL